MNRSLIFCFGIVLAISAMPFDVFPSSMEECNLCRHIVGAAERHFQPNVTTQDSLKRELDRECVAFSHTHDKNVSQQCIIFVNANIATIYADISAGKRPEAVCVDIQICQAHPTAAVAQQLPEHDPCNTCTFIIGRAEHHFRQNETAEQLQKKLEKECQRLGHLQGQEAGQHCKQIVDTNIQTIYNDIKAGKRPHQICIDIGECQVSSDPTPSALPEFKHVFASGLTECLTCEFIIGRAENHYHNRNVTDKNRLLRELEHECIQLDLIEGDDATIKCLDIVRQNIDVIFRDVQNRKSPRDVCVDIGECQISSDPTSPPPADLEHVFAPVPDECHICEFIIGRAEHHYHNRNVTNENRLLRELEHECIQLAHSQGDQASIKCLDVVRQNIDVIFRDVQNHKSPGDVCVDIGECQVSSDPTSPFPSVSFFL